MPHPLPVALVFLIGGLLVLPAAERPAKATRPVQPAIAQSDDDEATARRLCQELDLARPELKAVKEHAAASRHVQALEAWRDGAIDRLRRADLGEFTLHTYKTHPRQANIAELLVGRKQDAKHHTEFLDLYGLAGAPATAKPIDWMATIGDEVKREGASYARYTFATPLAARFVITGEAIYKDTWFAITDDFVRRQKTLALATPVEKRGSNTARWAMNHGDCLGQADRTETLLKCLAVFAKALPSAGGQRARDWVTVLAPLAEPAAPAAKATIPAGAFARIVLSLLLDHPEPNLTFYTKSGITPNQRRHGLNALILVAWQFREFKAAAPVGERAAAAFGDWMRETLHNDGGMIEQSFNYNQGDARNLEELVRFLGSDAPPWAVELGRRVEGWRRLTMALATPLGALPVQGNNHTDNPPPVWRDAGARQRLGADEERLPRFPKPAFTSVAFPFSGYYALRRDWSWDSPYLYFANPRPATGHMTLDALAIEVHAFGRPLLVRAGPPPYNPSFVAPAMRKDYDQIDDYFSEGAPAKANVVLVDGHGQSRNTDWAKACPTTPIAGRWHSSARFDVVEGTYDLGYGDPKVYWLKNPKMDMTVAHRRQVVFVRQAGLWLVVDTLLPKDAKEHSGTQVWHLQPAITAANRGSVPGFTAAQVVVDEMAGCVRTTDDAGPNIWIQHLGGAARSYQRFHGAKNPFRGWYARSIGDAQPAPEVRVTWRVSGPTVQVTALVPARDAGRPYALAPTTARKPPGAESDKAPPPADPAEAGGELRLADGTVVAVQAAAGRARPLNAGTVSGTATLLVSVTRGGANQGLALDCRGITIAGRQGSFTTNDVEWAVEGGSPKQTATITMPTGFQWVEDREGLRPLVGVQHEARR